MLSVPAEVTVILLDIEGTTTPIAFVKVRGGRERGTELFLLLLHSGPQSWAQNPRIYEPQRPWPRTFLWQRKEMVA